jgi:flagellin-like hook-associated protein FlgL
MLALNTKRQLGLMDNDAEESTVKLSSGYKINKAADDAAGLAISEKMRKQIRGLKQAKMNIDEGVGYCKVADGALNEVQDMLHRMTELSVQAANGTNSDSDRSAIDSEVQQLKTEMDRVFETTKYNETYIWQDKAIVQTSFAADTYEQAVIVTTPSTTITIDNSNYDVISYNGYTTHADKNGVSISWTGYNGTKYQTNAIDWDTLKANGYKFQIADYFNKSNTDLFDAAGQKGVFDFTVSYNVLEQATVDDIIKGIDGVKMGASTYTGMVGEYDDTINNHEVTINSASLTYPAAYYSREYATSNGFDFENDFDPYLEANNTTTNPAAVTKTNLINDPCASLNTTITDADVTAAKTNKDNWEFEFYMEGIGRVTATSGSISYYAPSDIASDDEGYWFRWYTTSYGKRERYSISHGSSEQGRGTLGSVMAALTGKKGTSTPGLLTAANGGDCDNGGYITISFSLTSDNTFYYGDNVPTNSVGSFSLRISVKPNDTEASILQKIKNTLNSDTILDFKSSAKVSSQRLYIYSANESKVAIGHYNVDGVVYPGMEIPIQSGADAKDKLVIKYDCLRVKLIGLTGTNVLTEDSATSAIGEVSEALKKISEQRSLFGAYQNRLEHAANINDIVAENTESAESVIRDTDMALEMVKYSNANILRQAAQSMLAQANQSKEGVFKLLGQ